jgi:IS1 family transposase
MNQLDTEKRAQVLLALCEGNSIRSITRMFNVGKNTVARLLIDAGVACAVYQDENLKNLKCERIQCDEIWSYVGAKDRNVPADKKGVFGYGSVWTWVGMDADSKLIASWLIGDRSADAACEFMKDLASRLANRVQLTTDGYNVYLNAVEQAFGSGIDYAMLVKIYGETSESEKRYSPAECIGAKRESITGSPDKKHISTSYVERQNLTMRMHMRRFTRLTNAFSKRVEHHVAAVALHFMYYNFVKIHGSLKVTPAMAAGVTDHLWEMTDVVRLVEEKEAADMEAKREAKAGRDSSYGPALGHSGSSATKAGRRFF